MKHHGIVLAMLAACAVAQQPPLSYSLLEPAGGPQPLARVDGTIAYDPAGRRVFLFGGQSEKGNVNDLWFFSLAQRRWTELVPAGDKPPGRLGHTLLLDARRQRLLLFGGQAGGFFSDTWAYDLERNQWQQLAPDNAGPSRRYGHSAILDTARDRMVISHGFTNSGRFDDTWAFDLATSRWRDISPSRGRPLRRCLHHAVYDDAGGQMLLYGGCASGAGPCPLGDLWSFDLAAQTWQEITGAPKPPERDHYGVAFDSARGRMVVFAGSGRGFLNDTWEFDARARSWRQAVISGAPPVPRSRLQGAFAADRGVTFFFGGDTATGKTAELWMLGPAFAAARPQISRGGVVNAFSGSGGAVSPGELVAIHGTGLGPFEGFALGFDSVTGKLPVSGPGLSVAFNGVATPLYYVSSTQLNVQVPYEVQGAGEVAAVVTVNGSASEPAMLPVVPVRPALHASVFHADGSLVTAERPALSGEVLVLFATGYGVTVPASATGTAPPAGGVFGAPAAPVELLLGGRAAEILFAGQAPGTAGVLQINARVPDGLASGAAVSAVLRVGGAESPAGVSFPHGRPALNP